MILALLAATATQSVATTERAFAAAAQTQGQWTAFRAFAAPDARMLADGPKPVAEVLANARDPKVAVMWWPGRIVLACDGSLALSTGPWRRDGGRKAGRYFTMWQRQPDGAYRWLFDGGSEDKAETPGLAAADKVFEGGTRRACRRPAWPATAEGAPATGGHSADDSLRWRLDSEGALWRLRVWFNPGSRPELVADAVIG